MSLKIAVNSADDQGERVVVQTGHHNIEQLDYQPVQTSSYDEDVERMSVNEYNAH